MSDDGATYAAFIEAQVKSEREHRVSIETRGTAIVTTSSAFLALVVAVVTVLVGKDYVFTTGAKVLLTIAAFLFLVAGMAGLAANQLRPYLIPDPATLEQFASQGSADPPARARPYTAFLNVDTYRTLQHGNHWKTWCLDWALRIQLLAALFLSFATAWELARRK